MARKKRRVRSAPPPPQPAATTADEAEPQPVASSTGRRDQEAKLREEYAYVVKDLRLIGIVAILMFALLIALNLAI